jgi:hypothetical protein
MHEKYTTRGIVVSSSAYKEADKIISIYTEDFGLVSAAAAGVRRSHSKLKYHVQDFSVRNFSFVRGRDIWRLVGAEEISGVANFDHASWNGAVHENLVVYARVLSLIRRLVRGEEKNEQVFLTLFSLHKLLAQMSESQEKNDSGLLTGDFRLTTPHNSFLDISALETLAVFRILHSLGYIKSDKHTEPLIVPLEIDSALVAMAKPLVSSLILSINKGLTESHL